MQGLVRHAGAYFTVLAAAIAVRLTIGTAFGTAVLVLIGIVLAVGFAYAIARGGERRVAVTVTPDRQSARDVLDRPMWITVAMLSIEWLTLGAVAFLFMTWDAPWGPEAVPVLAYGLGVAAPVAVLGAFSLTWLERRWARSVLNRPPADANS